MQMSCEHGREAQSSQLAPPIEWEKLNAEKEFRREEIELRKADQRRLDDELAFKKVEAKRSRWWSPLVIAILGAALAAVGNAVVAWVNGRDQQAIEAQKAESERILAAIRTNNPDAAATNLKFLIDAGLITQAQDKISSYLKGRTPGQGPALPSSVQALLPNLESDVGPERHETRTLIAGLGSKAIPALTEMLARNRDHAAANYRQVLGVIEALAEMAPSERCAAYAENPGLRRDVEAHAGIEEETLVKASARALVCPR
jgi:hypothetical protein